MKLKKMMPLIAIANTDLAAISGGEASPVAVTVNSGSDGVNYSASVTLPVYNSPNNAGISVSAQISGSDQNLVQNKGIRVEFNYPFN